MKICWFGIYTKDYPRNKILISGLISNGVEVIECHADWRQRGRYFILIKKLLKVRGSYDLIYCAYPGAVPAILAKIFGGSPVVIDAFYSMFDSAVNDRQEIRWYHPKALRLLFLDWVSALAADWIITDTVAHKKYWSGWPLIKEEKIFTEYLGADSSYYYEIIGGKKESPDPFIVHFHGNYIPLHGTMKIVQAARILEDSSMAFRLIGSGGEFETIKRFVEKNHMKNIEFIPRVSPKDLNVYINKADVVLGIFGGTAKAQRVIPNKVYEGMAVRKPVISMDTPAMREIFDDNDLLLVKNSPEEIAKSIIKLKNGPELRWKIAENGHNKVVASFSPKPLGTALLRHFNDFLIK